ncbi:MAG: Ca-activated chloride channel family protein [Sphingobacteriales bacterium]|jgi:Ca-activated chloride channel family protein
MEILKFEHSEYLYALALVPVLWLLFALYKRWRRKKLAIWGDPKSAQRLLKHVSTKNRAWKAALIIIAVGFTVLGLANLQQGSELKEVKLKGVDMMIALDLSRSMEATDVSPSRLDRAKLFISQLLNDLGNDRVGLIIFAGNAYVQMPLTADKDAASLFLSSLNTDIMPSQGTAIGEAIDLAGEAFRQTAEKNRVMLIISDGENHEPGAIEKIEELAKEGVIVHTVGVGSEKGGPIPVGRTGDYRRDKEGNIILSKLNEPMLIDLADKGNGNYFRISNGREEISRLTAEIDKMEKNEQETQIFADYDDKFQYFLGFAFLLAFAEILILERRRIK